MTSSILVHHDTFSKFIQDFLIHISISEKKILAKFTERKKYFLLELRNETCGQKVQLHYHLIKILQFILGSAGISCPTQKLPTETFGSPFGSTFGSPFGSPFGPTFGIPFESPFGSPFESPFGSPFYLGSLYK